MTIERADEVCSVACDTLCRWPFEITEQEALDEKCEVCPLVQELMKEVGGNG